MIEELIESQWQAVHDTPMPRQRFFTPNQGFWEEMESLKSGFDMIIDCGTGNGELPDEAMARGIIMAGIDIMPRDGNGPCEVQIIPAHKMPYSSKVWALVCRPNHSGWCNLLQKQAQHDGAGFIYVGLLKNIEVDLDFINTADRVIHNVGEESESMFIWMYP